MKLIRDPRIRFLIAGGSAAGVTWLVRLPLGLIMPFWASILVAQAIGLAYGFVVFRNWAFTNFEDRPVLAQIRDFLGVNAAGAATTAAVALPVQAILVAIADISVFVDPFAHAVGIAAGAVVNYVGHRQFTFRPRPVPEARTS